MVGQFITVTRSEVSSEIAKYCENAQARLICSPFTADERPESMVRGDPHILCGFFCSKTCLLVLGSLYEFQLRSQGGCMRALLTVICILLSYSFSYAAIDSECGSTLAVVRIHCDVEAWLKLDLIKSERLVIKFVPDVSPDEIISLFEEAAQISQDAEAAVKVVSTKRSKLGVLANQQTIMLLMGDSRIVSIYFDPSHGGGQSGSSVGN